jgi:integrase
MVEHHAPDLAEGAKGAGLDTQTLKKVLDEIAKLPGNDSFRTARRALDRILRQMQKVTGGAVRLPTPVVSIPRKASPFRPENFRHIPWLSQVVEAFERDLEEQANASDELSAGRILLSAIVFGGLLNETLVERLPAAVVHGFHKFGDNCWLDIPLGGASRSEDRVRRWFPDPLTQCLIVRWIQSNRAWPKGSQASPGELLQRLLDRLSTTAECAKTRVLTHVLQTARVRARLLLPGVLVDFLQSENHGQSVPSRTWWRVAAKHHLEITEAGKSNEELAQEFCAIAELSESSPTAHRLDSSEDLAAVGLLKDSLKGKRSYLGPVAAARSVRTLRDSLGIRGPMLTALVDWTEWLLHLLSTGERRAKPQSIHRYLVSIATRLVALGGEVDPGATPPSALESLYRDVLSSIRSSREHQYASVRLRDFHTFLMLTRDVGPVEIDGELTSTQEVRANILSEDDYRRALDELGRSESDERTRAMRRVILILAYRAGPRRRELSYVRIADVQAGLDYASLRPLLWIHAHPDASLKTYASLRRLPLAHLLTPAELREVKDWLSVRLRETSLSRPDQSLLLCERGRNTEPLHYSKLDDLIELLRGVCEDNSIVFHTLRHSFLSNLFLLIFIAELEVRASRKISCPWLPNLDVKRLLRRLFQSGVLPREGAYLLSALAGHIDPDETMHTYIHFQDWIAGLYVRELGSSHKLSLWAALERIRVDALMVRHSRVRARTKTQVLPHLDTPNRLLATLDLALPVGHPPPEKLQQSGVFRPPVAPLRRLPLEGIYSCLAFAGKSMNWSTRELLTGVDSKTHSRLRSVALEIARIETSTRNSKGRRRRIMAPKVGRRRPELYRLPQLEGFGPAIPRPTIERTDARQVFTRATSMSNDQATSDDMLFLLSKTSHSDPVVRLHSVEEVNRAVSLLTKLGIARRRIALEIKSVPREPEDSRAWFRDVASRTGFPRRTLIARNDPTLLPRAIKRHVEGVMALRISARTARVVETSGTDATKSSLSYGWRVGCFYALCVLRTLEPSDASPQRT